MVSEDLVEVARGRPVRVDVRVGVEDRPPRHLLEELTGGRVGRRSGGASGRRHGQLGRAPGPGSACSQGRLPYSTSRGPAWATTRGACKCHEKGRPAMNVLVTGGGTSAPIDDVRTITNVSSGRFAASIAESCLSRGAAGLARPRPLRPAPPAPLGPVRPRHRPTRPPSSIALRDCNATGRRSATGSISSPCGSGTVADYAETLEHVLRSRVDRRRLPRDGGLRLRADTGVGQGELRRRPAHRPMPSDPQGHPLRPRLGPRRSTLSASSSSRASRPSELIRQARAACTTIAPT